MSDLQEGDVVYIKSKSSKKFAVVSSNDEAHQTDWSTISCVLSEDELEGSFGSAFVVENRLVVTNSILVSRLELSALDGAGIYYDESDKRLKVAYQQYKPELQPVVFDFDPINTNLDGGKRVTMSIADFNHGLVSSFSGKFPMGPKPSTRFRQNHKYTIHVDMDAR